MGGLISNVEVETEEKVPFFGDVPVIGHLFKGTTKSVEKRELVIFLTTTIIDGKDGKL
jgi:type II secretory pathway component HofQ